MDDTSNDATASIARQQGAQVEAVPDDVQSAIRTQAQSAYEVLAKLHAEVMKYP